MNKLWLVTNKDTVRTMEHEADYDQGDALVEVEVDSNGLITVRIHRPADE